MEMLRVDCDRCAVRGRGCSDCVISVLLGVPEGERASGVDLAPDERAALAVLADSGLLPPLRIVEAVSGPDPENFLWIQDRFAE